ncbi:hypothetical protein [Geitlerinema calcuttense]|uniref:Secreted protein n=1 Tax=Geitlerinema calcuttense NRMC-F 0142 TaxID=2922238 RepID=A0ABT7LZ01_9CYAN|nr:hypothetical protein [Geitlerinema calcuttense]MDL5057232.1 hypothetical protein [Geitlerinema calcuttense NRMC-F 0142]
MIIILFHWLILEVNWDVCQFIHASIKILRLGKAIAPLGLCSNVGGICDRSRGNLNAASPSNYSPRSVSAF